MGQAARIPQAVRKTRKAKIITEIPTKRLIVYLNSILFYFTFYYLFLNKKTQQIRI